MVVVGKTSFLTIIGLEDVRLSTLELCLASTFDPQLQYPKDPTLCWGGRNGEFPRVCIPPKRGDDGWGTHFTSELGKIKRRTLISGSLANFFQESRAVVGVLSARTPPQSPEKADHQGSSAGVRQPTFVHEGIITSLEVLCQLVV